jgi:hypothetical protein
MPPELAEALEALKSLGRVTVIVAVPSAAVSFLAYNTVGDPDLVEAAKGAPAVILLSLGALTPVLLFLSANNLIRRKSATVADLQIVLAFARRHLALVLACLILIEHSYIPAKPDADWDELGMMILRAIGWAILFVSVLCNGLAWSVSRRDLTPLLGTGTFIGSLAGVGLGALLWSLLLPPTVLEEIEHVAGDQPYCMLVLGQPAEGFYDLSGLSMFHRSRTAGYHSTYYGLLIVDEGAGGPSYWNWSFHSAQFEPALDRIGNQIGGRCRLETGKMRSWWYW